MVTIMQLTDNLKSYISSQLESMSKSSPVIGFMKPLITRALDKNFSKITKALELIADKDGNVDVEGILTEMMENLMTTNPFSFKTSFIGDIEIGGGQIKFNLPLTNKRLVLNMSDLVSDMYHTEGGRKYSGEKFDIHKAKEICERYRGVIPVSATPTDVYVAINSQYHDYVELFKSWFGDNVDQKIIESAIIFWFKDVDCKSINKVVSYFKEY